MMNNLSFAHSDYLHLLWLLPVLVLVRIWAGSTSTSAASAMVAQRLRSLLIAGASPVLAWLVFALQMLCIALFVFALAQPRWGEHKRQITESGKNVLLAIDTSKSMLADDLKPNRLMRAKLAAQDLVDALKEQRVGLIAFAGRAYLQAPLTTDHAAVVESLQALDTFTIPLGGTSISSALREALESFAKTKARSHGLIIISDGGEPDSELEALLGKAREKHITVITIGVGTELGGLIPDPDPDRQGDYVRDPATNNPVHTRLEEGTLQAIAKATNGRYLRLGERGLDNNELLKTLQNLESMNSGTREEVKPIERFYWPLSLGIFCLMLSLLIRPSARLPRLSPAAAGLMFLLSAQAADGAVLSLRQTLEEAKEAYKQQNFVRARDLYARLLGEDPPPPAGRAEEYAYGLGAAAHQMKDYDRAIDGFSRALRSSSLETQARSHQGLGNTLYEQGAKALQQQPEFTIKAWVDSLAHYDAALTIKDDKAVRENFEFVRKKLALLEQQQAEAKRQEEEKRKQEKKEKGEKKDQDGPGEKGDQQEEGEKGEKDKGDPSGGEQEEEQNGKKPGDQTGESDEEQKNGKQGKGEQQEAKEGEAIPEGKIQAGKEGEGRESEKQQGRGQKPGEEKQADFAEEQTDERTGFSKNEARALLRAYSDQMQLQFQRRQRDRSVKKDW